MLFDYLINSTFYTEWKGDLTPNRKGKDPLFTEIVLYQVHDCNKEDWFGQTVAISRPDSAHISIVAK